MAEETQEGEGGGEVAAQYAFDLPEFEGAKPVGVMTKINGSGQRITRPLSVGETLVLIVEVEVTGVDHKKSKDGLKRIQTLAVADLYEVEGKPGRKALSTARLAHKKQDDARAGRLALAGVDEATIDPGPEVTVDGNGTALTEAEVAEARGETVPNVANAIDPDIDLPESVVLVFPDDSRCKWPDDFTNPDLTEGHEPIAGDFILRPSDSEELQIIKVLDVDTGETIEEWTAEQENQRLLDLENELLAKEQAEAEAAAKKAKPKKGKKAKAEPEVIDPPELDPADDIDGGAE